MKSSCFISAYWVTSYRPPENQTPTFSVAIAEQQYGALSEYKKAQSKWKTDPASCTRYCKNRELDTELCFGCRLHACRCQRRATKATTNLRFSVTRSCFTPHVFQIKYLLSRNYLWGVTKAGIICLLCKNLAISEIIFYLLCMLCGCHLACHSEAFCLGLPTWVFCYGFPLVSSFLRMNWIILEAAIQNYLCRSVSCACSRCPVFILYNECAVPQVLLLSYFHTNPGTADRFLFRNKFHKIPW